jgi:RNA ligase (TIGR02306 family)
MADHKVEVVPIVLEVHPNADSLSLVRVFDNYVCCVRTEDWVGKSIGVFVPPDSILPDKEEYKFLQGHLRIKTRKFRGVMSQGLLLPAPEGTSIGDDVAEQLGIIHWEPELSVSYMPGNSEPPPPIKGVEGKYDIESWFKYGRNFEKYPDLEVIITEKIHGTNSRFTFQEGRMWVASRAFFRKPDPEDLYWKIITYYPWIEAYCRLNPGAVLFGEIFGAVQRLKYGATQEKPYFFRMFDVFEGGKFLDWTNEIIEMNSDRVVPILYHGLYSKEIVKKLIDGPSTIPGAKHCREGIVIKPKHEIYHEHFGRLILKAVSPTYLEKS